MPEPNKSLEWKHPVRKHLREGKPIVGITLTVGNPEIPAPAAAEEIEAIAATPGIDVLFIGTSDLAFSLGLRGDQKHPMVRGAVARVVAAPKAHGKILASPATALSQIQSLVNRASSFPKPERSSDSWKKILRNFWDARQKKVFLNKTKALH